MANLLPAVDNLRTQTAGAKSEPGKVKNAAQVEVPVVLNPFHDLASALHLTGGPHPESVPTLISTALTRATDAIVGPHGGTVAPRTSVTAPGPAGGVNAAAGDIGAVVQATKRQASSIASRLRKLI
jgi:ribulose 1,5-bisphosphate carboxylase large subunit-like protein